MIWLIIGLITLTIIYFLFKPDKTFFYNNIKTIELKKFFEILLYRGYAGGVIVIECDEKQDVFLQFVKKIEKRKIEKKYKNVVALELAFPLIQWSEKYYNKLHDLITREKIRYELEAKEGEYNLEFTYINCKQNLDYCIYLAEMIYKEIFDVKDLNFKISFKNCSPRDVRIGFD